MWKKNGLIKLKNQQGLFKYTTFKEGRDSSSYRNKMNLSEKKYLLYN